MRTLIAGLALMSLSGCMMPPQNTKPPAVEDPAACFTKEQCDAMWSEAAIQIQSLSGMKLQVLNDTFMQTFNPTSPSLMAGMARKVPMPDGSTVFDATFTCRFCNNLNYEALNLFTRNLKMVGRRFGSTTLGGGFTPNSSIDQSQRPTAPVSAPALSKEQQLQQLQQQRLPYDEYQKRYREIMAQ
ncbi:hypothetical protein [Metapseudomonas otitidis]|uniref:hypothetical protein n=1 Tax=Metapseudomonas otitidis TaxID=319939 RepID=UPI00244B7505|nr:hypothetical protein [Pseudomonas otitidis]MDG9785242.1 hypothetical protein [Pseudomonas otitidis]